MAREPSDTRARLLQIARQHFGSYGFERTTVRGVASEARIDPAMIIRYFGSKDALFAEAASIELGLPSLAGMQPEQAGEALVRHFVRRWEGPGADDLLRVLIRSAATNEAAAARMKAIFREQVATMVARIAPAHEARMRGGLIASQMLGLAYCRYVLELGEPDLSDERVIRSLGRTIQRYLFDKLDAS